MSQGFWTTLTQPIIGLSPMDGVSDHPFRHIQKKYGKPAVVYTEFTSCEGVCHGAVQLLKDFLFDETQRPVIGQIYGTTPEYFRQTAIVLCELGFDGIDINMGCPAKNVAHSGAGAALIKTPKLAQEIIAAVKQGITDWQNGTSAKDCPDLSPEIIAEVERRHAKLPAEYQNRQRRIPVSIKTRMGYDSIVVEDWIKNLLEMEPSAIALHGRTLKQQYGGQADWEVIGRAAAITSQTPTLLLGNGDVQSHTDALEKIRAYNLNGVLIGRATFGNPYVFLSDLQLTQPHKSYFEIAIEHAQLYENTFSNDPKYNFLPMRKHLGWYVRGVENASQIRVEIYQSNTTQEAVDIFAKYGLL